MLENSPPYSSSIATSCPTSETERGAQPSYRQVLRLKSTLFRAPVQRRVRRRTTTNDSRSAFKWQCPSSSDETTIASQPGHPSAAPTRSDAIHQSHNADVKQEPNHASSLMRNCSPCQKLTLKDQRTHSPNVSWPVRRRTSVNRAGSIVSSIQVLRMKTS